MKVIRSIKRMQQICLRRKKNATIAVVPTMGFLHAGHLSLVKLAQKHAETTIVTLFVNPTQFGKNEDYRVYPRDEKGDLNTLRAGGVDYAFLPAVSDMYPEGFQTSVQVREVTRNLCGKSRPGHFTGVATVVLKLFNITRPNFAVFGQKDYQQLLTVQALVRDLNLPVRILSAPIVRDKDGLAMSSRNARLMPGERRLALCLYEGLTAARKTCQKSTLSAEKIKAVFRQKIPEDKRVKLDYVACVHAVTLEPLKIYQKNNTLLAAAVFVGRTRLIDNVVF